MLLCPIVLTQRPFVPQARKVDSVEGGSVMFWEVSL